ncbi:cell division protein ZapD [Thalassotalea sp. HSM 43]|uniref:cell division protein ZapD n=1 Tax=Thalassotalea sp. HSM 43 TaxID=2552945 RepID=UPI00108091CF|nr:cell division protein ZapD [Thalassotalea sp. HSM 43]QBY04838.1 cell division protein ZapD [Thalassotalea sp. HSM 43]
MAGILYEHPLNERIRNYLKLEQLFAQARSCLAQEFESSHTSFFNALFTILDTIDRTDVRGDMIKDLEKLEHNLHLWSKSPAVNDKALQLNLEQTKKLSTELRSKQNQWGSLKEDKFLDAMRKRFSLTGAYCGFDLPALVHWLNQPPIFIQQDIDRWLSCLSTIEQALVLVLKFIRQKSNFELVEVGNSFYQDNGEGLLLLRIELEDGADYFPSVSGNRYRYSIRFMELCDAKGQQYITDNVSFKLAKC